MGRKLIAKGFLSSAVYYPLAIYCFLLYNNIKIAQEEKCLIKQLQTNYYMYVQSKGGRKMSDKMEVYYFSPTGGTNKVSSIFAAAVGKEVIWHDLGDKQTAIEQPQGELIAVAAPVFAGRIPSVVSEKIKMLCGKGKKAVAIAVYGNRAYEDALLEMHGILYIQKDIYTLKNLFLHTSPYPRYE